MSQDRTPSRVGSADRFNRRTRGQSLVEFALILPIALTLMGAAIDVARVYGAWVTLEAATRDAAELVASDPSITTASAATAKAKAIVCSQLVRVTGYAAPPGEPTNCTSPSVSVTWSAPSTSAPGATVNNPIGSATVTASLNFRVLFSYPLFTQGGAWTIRSTQSYAIVQGR